MSNTNGDIILGALQLLGVVPGNQRAPDANQGEHGLSVLNDMIFEWEAQGVDLQWSNQTSTTDPFPLDLNTKQTVKTNLAVRLSPTYGKSVDPVTVGMATAGFERLMRDAAISSQSTQVMDNLPLPTARWYWPSRILSG